MAAGRIDPLALREHTEQLPVPATVALCFSFILFPFFLSLSLSFSSSFSPSSFVCFFCFYHHMMRSGALFLLSAKHRECNRLPAAIAYTTPQTHAHTHTAYRRTIKQIFVRSGAYVVYTTEDIGYVTIFSCFIQCYLRVMFSSCALVIWCPAREIQSAEEGNSKIKKRKKKNKKRSKT